VIGTSGNLTGYAGGLDRKRWLLTHEHALPEVQSGRQGELLLRTPA
jgi:methylated-DNA-[protein]-cysteine S-methyltransferase